MNNTANGTIKADSIRACIHCHLLRELNGKLVCTAPEATSTKLDVVLGQFPQRGAYEMRAPKGACGPEGRLWREIGESLAAEVDAIARTHGPSMATKVKATALHVLGAPARAGQHMATSWAAFTARCGAAKAAFFGIRDNVRGEPGEVIALKAEPVEEAKAIQDGAAPVVNEPLAAELLKPGSDAATNAQVEALRDTAAQMRAQDAGEAAPAAKPAAPVPLATPSDPRKEAAIAQAVSLAVVALLLGYIAAGMAYHEPKAERLILDTLKANGIVSRTCCEKGKPARCYPCPDGPQQEVRTCPVPTHNLKRPRLLHA